MFRISEKTLFISNKQRGPQLLVMADKQYLGRL